MTEPSEWALREAHVALFGKPPGNVSVEPSDLWWTVALALDAARRKERERCFRWAIGRVPRSEACRAIRDGTDPGFHDIRDPHVCWRCGEPLHQGHACT